METHEQGFRLLATQLDRHRDEICQRWAEMAYELTSSTAAELAFENILSATEQGLDALIESLADGNEKSLEDDVYPATIRWLDGRLDAVQAVEGIMLLPEAVLSVLERNSHSKDVYEYTKDQMAASLWRMCGRFARCYAVETSRRLSKQQANTELLLDTIRTSSSTLELEQVLSHVGDAIVSVVSVESCGFFLVDERSGIISPRFMKVVPAVRDYLDSRQGINRFLPPQPVEFFSPFLRAILELKQPMICLDIQNDPRFDSSFPRTVGFRSVLALPFVVQGQVVAVAYALTVENELSISEEQINLVWGLADVAALAIGNARLFEESRERLSENQSLQRLTAALLRELDLDAVLEIVCQEAQELVDAVAAGVLLLDGEKGFQVVYHSGDTTILESLLADGALNRQALDEDRPVTSDCTDRKGRFSQGLPLPNELLAVPLVVKGSPVGIVNVVSKPGGFDPGDERLIGRVADQAALAIERARLYKRVRELAICEERDRLAREMHDNLAQVLSTINWRASTVDRLLSEGQIEGGRTGLRELKSVAKKGYSDVRQTVYALRSSTLLGREFLPSLQAYLEESRERFGLEINLTVDEEPLPQLSMQVRLQVIRIIQEALSNIGQHSGAQSACICFHRVGKKLQIEIEDHGRGFELERTVENDWHHFGLLSMRERAMGVGAEFQIWSQPGQGTRITLSLPLTGDAGGKPNA